MATSTQVEFVEEQDVNKDRIEELFKRAYFTVFRDDDDDLVVDDDLSVFVFVKESAKRIRFLVLIHANPEVDMARKLEVVNRINDEYAFCRVYVPSEKEDVLGADLELTFEGGIIPLHIVSLLRKFMGSVGTGLREHGKEIL
jgi:hypothetical protein